MSAEKSPSSYYTVLGVMPSASVQDIRRAYRELSKLYHPDTTTLPSAVATEKFQKLNEAYATLSSPDLRASYDIRNGYSRVRVMRPDLPLDAPQAGSPRPSSSAYLDPTDRPLSPGEIFALFILGVTFAVCLLVVVMVGATRGEIAFQSFDQVPVPAILRTVLPSSSPSTPAVPSVDAASPQVGDAAAAKASSTQRPSVQPEESNHSPERSKSLAPTAPVLPDAPTAKTTHGTSQATESPTGDRSIHSTVPFPLKT
ncbi:J domain-containing protein [Vacuolonema iberomarrocanum]|uniref:J domain-containing protein n=1 Tax=Vacuolonema iberomarrocanum TaxID=3454632 RepID=UPI0019E3AE3F|nr:J domain-containing protein [filamentous cyanobacterium LEGE 07170]